MNRTIFSLLVLLLFGLLSQPVTAQRSPQRAQQEAEKGVAKMSEAEMRALLPTLKARYEELRNIIKTGNYSQLGNDGLSEALSKAAIADEYICVTADINAIEKRLGKIDSQKPKPQTEQQQQEETDQQQQEIPDQNVEEELQKKFDKKMGESQERYNQYNNLVEDNANAISEENRALERATGERDPNSVPITDAMMDESLSPTSETNSGERDGRIGISDKFKENKLEETKEEESEETKEEVPKEDEIRKLIMEIQNDINNF